MLAIEEVSAALTGTEILKVFAFAWYISRSSFIVSLIVFGIGYVLYTYGHEEEVRHKRMQREMLQRERIMALRSTPGMPQRQNEYYRQYRR